MKCSTRNTWKRKICQIHSFIRDGLCDPDTLGLRYEKQYQARCEMYFAVPMHGQRQPAKEVRGNRRKSFDTGYQSHCLKKRDKEVTTRERKCRKEGIKGSRSRCKGRNEEKRRSFFYLSSIFPSAKKT